MARAPWKNPAGRVHSSGGRIMKGGGVLFAVVLSLTACGSSSPSQHSSSPSAKGTVKGTISAPKGDTSIKNAKVELVKNGKTTAKPSVKSGKFSAKVPTGSYKVKVTGAGTCKSKSVKVKAGKTAKVKVDCKPKSS